jgi:hypothetical protein
MTKGFLIFVSCLNLSALTVAGFMFYEGGWAFKVGKTGIEYKDFVTILLTVLGLMLAILGAFLAMLAFYGFQAIQKEARRIAKDQASRVAKVEAVQVATKEGRIAGQMAAIQAAVEYLNQAVPAQVDNNDYGKAAGQDENGE